MRPAALLLLAALTAASCASENDFDDAPDTGPDTAPVASAAEATPNDLPGLLEEAGLVTFRTALAQAYLVDSLAGRGPFTVFAPTDRAFEKLAGTTPQLLLRPGNREQLRALVAYHIVPGALPARDIARSGTVRTYGGRLLGLQRRGEEILLFTATGGTARVYQADIEADNGVIHVIDAVLLPPPPGDTTSAPVLAPVDSAGQPIPRAGRGTTGR